MARKGNRVNSRDMIDEAIAEHVFGFKVARSKTDIKMGMVVSNPRPYVYIAGVELPQAMPHYSQSMSAAWLIVDKLKLHISPKFMTDGTWFWRVQENTDAPFVAADHDPALAICKAALKVLKIEMSAGYQARPMSSSMLDPIRSISKDDETEF